MDPGRGPGSGTYYYDSEHNHYLRAVTGTIARDEPMETRETSSNLPSEAAQHLAQASALHREGQCEQALVACERALELAPDSAVAHNLRGMILEELGRREEGIDAYREALRLAPGYREAHENLLAALAAKAGVKGKGKNRDPIAILDIASWAIALLGFLIIGVVVLVGRTTRYFLALSTFSGLFLAGLGLVVLGLLGLLSVAIASLVRRFRARRE